MQAVMSCDKHMQINVQYFVVSFQYLFAQPFGTKQHLGSFKILSFKTQK